MKIFLICPVRNATKYQIKKLNKYIAFQEANGNEVYYPARDTNQNDPIGYQICCDNRDAIKYADEVHIFFDKESQGTLFDLGMTFALDKKIKLLNFKTLDETPQKSFTNMVKEWARQ